MQLSQNIINLFGRVLMVALFLPAGISKASNFQGTVAYFGSLGIPFPMIATTLTIFVEIVGSIALLLGFQTRIVALVLAAFTLGASIFGHPFWSVPAEQVFVTQLLFYKNIAVIGGLLILASAGAGTLSLDKIKK